MSRKATIIVLVCLCLLKDSLAGNDVIPERPPVANKVLGPDDITGTDDETMATKIEEMELDESDIMKTMNKSSKDMMSSKMPHLKSTEKMDKEKKVTTKSPDMVPQGPPVSLQVVDAFGQPVNRVLANQKVTLKVIAGNDTAYSAPNVGQCWFQLLDDDRHDMTVLRPDAQFMNQGCSVQGENQLIKSRSGRFLISGDHTSEALLYLSGLYTFGMSFSYLNITCEVYMCKMSHDCEIACPVRRGSFSMDADAIVGKVSTSVYMGFSVFTGYDDVKPPSLGDKPAIPNQRASFVKPAGDRVMRPRPGSKGNNSNSFLGEYQPYLIVGICGAVALILLLVLCIGYKYVKTTNNPHNTSNTSTNTLINKQAELFDVSNSKMSGFYPNMMPVNGNYGSPGYINYGLPSNTNFGLPSNQLGHFVSPSNQLGAIVSPSNHSQMTNRELPLTPDEKMSINHVFLRNQRDLLLRNQQENLIAKQLFGKTSPPRYSSESTYSSPGQEGPYRDDVVEVVTGRHGNGHRSSRQHRHERSSRHTSSRDDVFREETMGHLGGHRNRDRLYSYENHALHVDEDTLNFALSKLRVQRR